MAPRTLILMRHGKSDWSQPVSDRERPLNERGCRQAGEAGRWLEHNIGRIDLAVVSPARRAADAWERASAQLSSSPPVRVEEAAYTFDGLDLLALVRSLGEEQTVVLVGHNPACEELLELLSGEGAVMKTSALAVMEMASWRSSGHLVTHGRPPQRRAV
ncbi:SixA phosphatase family protein [Ornithinimicrobium panacihumi]|uniref:SixA phosphatase family protein n=1 Tax=Ornithinimicrobium panacihumi TaxID=2008449 RepID=UPI003F8C5283